MLQEAKQNFENEMIKLIESNQENNQKSAIDFTKMIDNEELQSALQSCVNELEKQVSVKLLIIENLILYFQNRLQL